VRGGEEMENERKLKKAISKLLDKVNSDLDEGRAPNVETLEALRVLAQLTSLNLRLNEL